MHAGLVVAHAGGAAPAVAVDTGATLSLFKSCMHHMSTAGPGSGLVVVGDEGKLRLQDIEVHASDQVPLAPALQCV